MYIFYLKDLSKLGKMTSNMNTKVIKKKAGKLLSLHSNQSKVYLSVVCGFFK